MKDLLYPLTTMSFAYPWVLMLPLCLLFFAMLRRVRPVGALHPNLQALTALRPSVRQLMRALLLVPLALIAVAFLSMAAARPQRISVIQRPFLSHNLMLAIDISPSMGADDFETKHGSVTRLDGVKRVVSEFIKSRPVDRIGLAIFGGTAYLQAPLTLDHDLIQQLINRLQVGMAGDGTALGDGLGVCLKRMADVSGKSKAIVLLTDGVSNAGQVNPLKAAKVAADLGIKIHTIGIGSPRPVIVDMPGGLFARKLQARAEYDEDTLKEVAKLTGGVFFNATSVERLQEIYTEIDRLEKTASREPMKPLVDELFVSHALIALAAYALYVLLSHFFFMRLP